VEQVGGVQPDALVAEQLLHERGVQALLEHAEAGPGPDVRAERHPHAVLQVAGQREVPAPER
jgi:hypothetical protein